MYKVNVTEQMVDVETQGKITNSNMSIIYHPEHNKI